MTEFAPFGFYSDTQVEVTRSGGGAKVVQEWKEADFHCRITVSGSWLNLDDHENYIVEASSFAGSATTWRRNQVQSPYVAGKFTVSAVPDQVTENVAVYVLGDSQTDLMINLANLIDAISQPAFELQWSADNAVYIWQCDPADYTIDFINTNLYARKMLVKLQIQRSPLIGFGSW
jgi:hypothetical protein